VKQLCSNGLNVQVYARREQARLEAQALGAHIQPTPAALAASADMVILCLYSDQQVRDLVIGPEGFAPSLKPGASLVIHTTGSPHTAQDIATAIAPMGCRVLDVPVSGGPHNISAGNITLLAGGDAATLERCRPALSTYGNP